MDTLDPYTINNTRKAQIDILFFNRIEKVGSQSMQIFLGHLGQVNDFNAYRNVIEPVEKGMLLDKEDEEAFAEQIISLGEPSAYVHHANYMNFSDFDLPKPIYINMIRHPIEKVMSAYYYIRHPFIYSNYLRRNPNKKKQTKEYFDLSFNDCVKMGKMPDCVFDSHVKFNSDWRRFTLHLCGNYEPCKYVYQL